MIFLSILLIITSSIYFMLSSVYLYLQIFYQSIYKYISLSFSVSIFLLMSISLTLFLHRSPRITLSPFHHFSPLVHPPPPSCPPLQPVSHVLILSFLAKISLRSIWFYSAILRPCPPIYLLVISPDEFYPSISLLTHESIFLSIFLPEKNPKLRSSLSSIQVIFYVRPKNFYA